MIETFRTQDVRFNFRRRTFRFALSQELFSSAAVDTGTALLLRFLSRLIDEDRRAGRMPPKAILDAGSGTGVIGICAAAAYGEGTDAAGEAFHVRAQDRDELARLFTEDNARQNGIPQARLHAHAEPLLGGPSESRWDLILSNVPAKAGAPVLEDFLFRSAALLKEGGRALIVVVKPLEDFFRSRLAAGKIPLLGEEEGPGHRIFLYGSLPNPALKPVQTGDSFFRDYPFYRRAGEDGGMEGTACSINTVWGAADFDRPGGALRAGAKLLARLRQEPRILQEPRLLMEPIFAGRPVLIHEGGQGRFSAFLAARYGPFLSAGMVLSGRNILALEAARHNTLAALRAAGGEDPPPVRFVPLARLSQAALKDSPALEGGLALDEGPYGFVAAFPENLKLLTPQALWEDLNGLLAGGGTVLAGLPSAGAERFDRVKPRGFTRTGDLKREGFRALSYRKN